MLPPCEQLEILHAPPGRGPRFQPPPITVLPQPFPTLWASLSQGAGRPEARPGFRLVGLGPLIQFSETPKHLSLAGKFLLFEPNSNWAMCVRAIPWGKITLTSAGSHQAPQPMMVARDSALWQQAPSPCFG